MSRFSRSRFGNFLSAFFAFMFIAALIFGFLAFCNWNINPSNWNGFSRFLMGMAMFLFVLKSIDEY